MGFQYDQLKPSSGGYLYIVLAFFCSGASSPLLQLSEKLGCLIKRTPRTLGDLFGFMWHLNSQLFQLKSTTDKMLENFFQSIGVSDPGTRLNSDTISAFKDIESKIADMKPQLTSPSVSQLQKSLVSVYLDIPFFQQLFMVTPADSLPAVLFKVKNIPHQTLKKPQYNGDHKDLYSLYNSTCSEPNCGPYLYPLTHSDGATFAPTHASTYISWVLYLSDDLQAQLQEMLEEFKNIRCDNCSPKCSCTKGRHDSSNCSCPSVVDCADFLPLLYRHGFRFLSAFRLKGMKWENSNSSKTYKQTSETKRTCANFHTQLQTVINGDPLYTLLVAVDKFLYAIRWEFFSKLSAFWTIYICLILYTFFFLLDTLHLRSHLKLTASHMVPPLALLTAGKPLPMTKLTYIRK
ncbi:extracellular matrix-binding ebh, putative [Babesia caballi]|uniref:Extracellular matrix-binding ebh, putative n=1 Tax=Babesia caballi TaxID=5871 RepID=A0AAV4LPE9_BABCB|nr:extracellular matrix-binding ebh, putative [Babesia caballi]